MAKLDLSALGTEQHREGSLGAVLVKQYKGLIVVHETLFGSDLKSLDVSRCGAGCPALMIIAITMTQRYMLRVDTQNRPQTGASSALAARKPPASNDWSYRQRMLAAKI